MAGASYKNNVDVLKKKRGKQGSVSILWSKHKVLRGWYQAPVVMGRTSLSSYPLEEPVCKLPCVPFTL